MGVEAGECGVKANKRIGNPAVSLRKSGSYAKP